MTTAGINRIIPDYSADDWELYDNEGRDTAALDLNRSLKQAINRAGSTLTTVENEMQPALERHSKLGANDSEGRNMVLRVAEKLLRNS